MAELEQSPSHTQHANNDEHSANHSDAASFDVEKTEQQQAEADVSEQDAQTEHENPFEDAHLETTAETDTADNENKSDEQPAVTAESPQKEDEESEEGPMIYAGASIPPANHNPAAHTNHDNDEDDTDNSRPTQAPDTGKLNVVLDGILASRPDPKQLKADIEAVLFITSKALQVNDIAEIVEAEAEDVEMALGELIQDYAFRDGTGLEVDDTDGYIIQVREDCARIVHKMMPLEMSAATLRTLSAIAIKAPVIQSDLIELRGSTAYDHIAELLTKKLVSKRRQGRSYVLNTTKAFDDYFKLKGDRRELETLVNRLKPEQKQNAQPIEEADFPLEEQSA